MKSVAIIGGGPAGALAAARLAKGDRRLRVIVFEEKLGWEKPCGGGLPPKVLRRYPFLLQAAEPCRLLRDAEFVAANGEIARVRLPRPLAIYSRSVLNNLLLRRADEAGANIIEQCALGFERTPHGWKIKTREGCYSCDHLVLAAGGRTSLRQRLAPAFGPKDLMLSFGYYLPCADAVLRVQFFEGFEGYAWAFPRPDHLSVGIAAKLASTSMAQLKQLLHGFMLRFNYGPYLLEQPEVFSHVLPALHRQSWKQLALAGPGWSLAGDAAGLADPITGEGISFAMRSGELVAESILDGAPETYPARLWHDFGSKLAFGARLADRFFCGTFLGEPTTTRMIQYASRSEAFRLLLENLVDGSQSYPGLALRVIWAFARSIGRAAIRSPGNGDGMRPKAGTALP